MKSLEQLVAELREVYSTYGSFLGPGKENSQSIGNEINAQYGFDGMTMVHERIRETVGRTPSRELEMAWHGIGSWR
jgi:hypothetical protein